MNDVEHFYASQRELDFIDRIIELEGFVDDEYHRGYSDGVRNANSAIKKILKEEGFWDE